MKLRILLFALALTSFAQSTSRNVLLSWTASTSSGVLGYQIFRALTPTGPFVTPLNGSLVTGTAYVDATAVIGQTYTYAVAAQSAACTPTTPVSTPCGQSQPATTTTNVPAQPAITVTVTITVP